VTEELNKKSKDFKISTVMHLVELQESPMNLHIQFFLDHLRDWIDPWIDWFSIALLMLLLTCIKSQNLIALKP
jgi:hypothetical protein